LRVNFFPSSQSVPLRPGRPRSVAGGKFPLPSARGKITLLAGVSGGVMVAQGSLEPFVMVRIHAGQPTQIYDLRFAGARGEKVNRDSRETPAGRSKIRH